VYSVGRDFTDRDYVTLITKSHFVLASRKARAKIMAMEGQETPPSWRFTGSSGDSSRAFNATQSTPMPAAAEQQAIRWTASEYIAHEKSPMWYLAFIGVTSVIAAITFLVTRDYVSTTAIVLICAAMGWYANRKPQVQEYEISSRGVRFAGKGYAFSEFRSFALVQDGSAPSVWLIPLKRIMPPLIMYFEQKDEDKIIDMIGDYLPHEQRDYDLVERFMRYLRF
jgi:hypothetical protein